MFRELFHYTRSEIRGIGVLVLLIIILLFIRIYQYKKTVAFQLIVSEYSIDTLSVKVTNETRTVSEQPQRMKEIPRLTEPVDPNTADYENLVRAGLTDRAANNLIKYRSRGGSLHSEADLLRIYGVDSTYYYRIRKNFTFPSPIEGKGSDSPQYPYKKPLDMNTAGESDLASLPGIGQVLSHRIIKFRNSLGGYYSVSQLAEVYGISDSLINALVPYLTVDTSGIRKLWINEASFEELKNHPYLNSFEARSIMEYRRIKGGLKNYNDLKYNNLVEGNNLNRIRHYLCFQKR